MRIAAGLVALAFVCSAVSAAESVRRSLTLDERVAAQKAIETVYWDHRIWPHENPQPKPPLSAVMSDDFIRARVEDYLKKSNALEAWWHRPITSKQLQAELDRMTRETRDPEILSELYAALGNDPALIAETLARPTLVERLIRNMYAADERFHGAVKRDAERALASAPGVAAMKALGGEYAERTIVRRGSHEGDPETPHENVATLEDAEWKDWTDELARRFGRASGPLPVRQVSALQEDPDRFFVSAVLSIDEDAAVVASVVWPKRSFDAWWSAERPVTRTDVMPEMASFTASAPTISGCTNDTWESRDSLPPGRYGHTAVWTGAEMIIWGGLNASAYFGSGSRYDPSTNSWASTSSGANVPSPRSYHTAIWTGTEMIVWGGRTAAGVLNTGARYSPAADSWTLTSMGANVPIARSGHTAVWTGAEMIVWGGGGDVAGRFNTGGRYNPVTDNWTPTSTGANVPVGKSSHTAVWTGTEMIVWGGDISTVPYVNTGGRYNPSTDAWTPTSTGVSVPLGRANHTAVWTGTEMIVWGGKDVGSGEYNTGGRYNPVTDSWMATSTGANVPTGRISHTAVWTGTEMIVWGGSGSGSSYVATGGRYDPLTDGWTATSTGVNVPSARFEQTAVWTGTEMIVWGGESSGSYPIPGGRYDPSTDSWIATFSNANAPALRYYHTAVWTGAEMIVWGGFDGANFFNTGGRYNPATNSWAATSVGPNDPNARQDHTAVWTGIEMIVWGGDSLSTGGRYNATTDSWRATSTGANVPLARRYHTAVWTGTEMIVWGGVSSNSSYLNTGGRYNPTTDTWIATSTGTNVPQGRYSHTAVWTGAEMIVWGGRFFVSDLNSGGRYNPSTNGWTATLVGANVPLARVYHTAVWTGTQMIVWGGQNDSNIGLNTGARYTPSTNTWAPTPGGANVPLGRIYHTALWTGTQMIVWGGRADTGANLNTGGRYSPSTNSWTATSTSASVPTVRSFHTSAWTGAAMLIWGGSPLDSALGLYCACPNGRLVYRDADGDGYGMAGVAVSSCDGSVPAGYVTNGTDCNDANPNIHPGVTEVCNGLDDDCDGTADTGGGALCDDGNPCTTDSCGGAAGCAHANNTVACNDGNACTTNDTCGGGVCNGGPPPDCRDADPCTIDTCNPAMGCVHTFSAGACDDANPCTIGETCASGVCTGPPNDGVACDDGSVCTTGDVCLGGSCTPGAVPLDCNDGNVCTTDSCGPVTGCAHVNNTSACDDGNACTVGDTCGAGTCRGTPVVCNDNNPCTDDSCNPATGACVSVNDDTNTCSDGNLCTQADACEAGVCVGSNPVACDGPCPPGFTPVLGLCQRTYDIAASALDNQAAFCDGTGTNRYNDCNGQSYGFHWTDLGAGLAAVTRVDLQVESGVNCAGTTSSLTLNGAPVGSFNPPGSCDCSPAHGTVSLSNLGLGTYAKAGVNAIAIMPSGNCEGLSQSASFGNNFARVTVTYAPVGPCKVGACAPATGTCSYSSIPDGTSCSADACTSSGTCGSGICLPGAPIVCNDGNPCTDDSCDPALGCVYTNNINACDDGNACTYGDTCAGGNCAGAPVPTPSEAHGVTVGKSGTDTTIAWTLATNATTSDVLRGDIASLPVGPGGGDEVCLGNTGATTMTDPYVPAPDSGVWYLIRGVNACTGSGTYGFQSVHGAPGAKRVSTTCP